MKKSGILITENETNLILFEGSLNNINKIAAIETDQFFDNLKKQLDIQTDILPKNCKFVKTIFDKKLLIIEEEPKIRTIRVKRDLSDVIERHKIFGKYDEYKLKSYERTNEYMFNISIPYVIYFIFLNNNLTLYKMNVFFKLTPLNSLYDKLLVPNLSNINSTDYTVCLNLDYEEIDKLKNLNEIVSKYIDLFWFKSFNSDYSENVYLYKDIPELCDYFTWEHHTKINPLFIFSTEWRSTGLCAEGIIKKHVEQLGDREFEFISNSIERNFITPTRLIQRNCEADIFINGKVFCVGDEISYNEKSYYITYFVYKNNTVDKIGLQNEEGDIIVDKTDNLLSDVKEKQIEKIKINDVEFKVGDVIKVLGLSIKELNQIIKSKDGLYQIRLNRDFYIANDEFVKKIEKIDLDNLYFSNIKLEQGKEYSFIEKTSSTKDLLLRKDVIYDSASISQSDIALYFHDKDHLKTYKVLLDDDETKIINTDDLLFDEIYFKADKIKTNTDGSVYYHKNIKDRFLISESYLRYDSDNCRNYFSKKIDESKELNSLSFKTFYGNINYFIGEEIIKIDWVYPEKMFNIYTILGFESSFDNLLLKVCDDNKNVSLFPLIDYKDGKNYFIDYRQVTRKLENYEIGMKIKSNVSSIVDFPKKDCNIIKAFVIDYPVPLVLCSNNRTISLNSLKKDFKVFKPGDKEYEKYVKTENSKYINYQTGDCFDWFGCLYMIEFSNARIIAHELECDYTSRMSVSNLNKFAVRKGLILPRIKKDTNSNEVNIEVKKGYPTIFSTIIESKKEILSIPAYEMLIGGVI